MKIKAFYGTVTISNHNDYDKDDTIRRWSEESEWISFHNHASDLWWAWEPAAQWMSEGGSSRRSGREDSPSGHRCSRRELWRIPMHCRNGCKYSSLATLYLPSISTLTEHKICMPKYIVNVSFFPSAVFLGWFEISMCLMPYWTFQC